MLVTVKGKGILCCVKFCTNKRRSYKDKKTGKVYYRKMCCKHERQKQKENNPIGYHYDFTKQNAKRRKIEWNLTLQEFKDFCNDNPKYLKSINKAYVKTAKTLSIDRINPNIGYQIGNIEIRTLAYNSRKRHLDKQLEEKYGSDYLGTKECKSELDFILQNDIF